MNHYNQNQSKDNKNIKKVVFGTVVTAMAALTLAACGNTNASATKNSSDTSPKTSQQEKNPTSATPEGSNANGNITNTPTTITQFEDTVEAAGFKITSGQDEDGDTISGATTEDNGTYYADIEIDGHEGNIAYNTNMWGISIPSLGISSSLGSVIGSSNGELAAWVRSQEKSTQN